MYNRLSLILDLNDSLAIILVGSYTPKSPPLTFNFNLICQRVAGRLSRSMIQDCWNNNRVVWSNNKTILGHVNLFNLEQQAMLK